MLLAALSVSGLLPATDIEYETLTGSTILCSAENSEGHPQSYEWYVIPPGSPESSKPFSTEESFLLLIDRSGNWQIQLWVYYAHLDQSGDPWLVRASGIIHASSVVADLAPPATEYTIFEDINLDATSSEIATAASATFLADAVEISGCSWTGVSDPSGLLCTIPAGELSEGTHELSIELQSGAEISTDSGSTTIVDPPPFGVDFSWVPDNPAPGQATNFFITLAEGYSIDDLVSMHWWWDDGSEEEDVSCPPQFMPDCGTWGHSFPQADYDVVQLEVTTSDGLIASAQHEIQIGTPPLPPTATFDVSSSPALLREIVQFSFTGSCEGSCSRNWDFGDGGTSTEENPTHSYLTPSTFNVSLEVANETDTDTTSRPLIISNCWIPDGGILQTGECYGTAITLTAPAAAIYQWDTGASTRQTLVSLPGVYDVDLAQNLNGCWSQIGLEPLFHQCTGQPAGNVNMDPEGLVDAADSAALIRELADEDGTAVSASGGGDLGAPGADLGDASGATPDLSITPDDLRILFQLIFSAP